MSKSTTGGPVDIKKLPRALQLAIKLEELDSMFGRPPGVCSEAAAKLRLMHESEKEGWSLADHFGTKFSGMKAANEQLLEALQVLLRDIKAVDAKAKFGLELQPAIFQASRAIIMAKESKT